MQAVSLACTHDKQQEVITDIGGTVNQVVVMTCDDATCYGHNSDLRSCHCQES